MAAPDELRNKQTESTRKCSRRWNNTVSFSAALPEGAYDAFDDSFCIVKYSENPFVDMRDSILEMITHIGVRDWKEMEELVYCYIALNSSEIHDVIRDAFLSLCCSFVKKV